MSERKQQELDVRGSALSSHDPGRNRLMGMVAACWLMAVVGAMAALFSYSLASGPTGEIPDRWPAGSRMVLNPGGYNLILFAHPRCPCTRATLGELEILMARYQGRLAAQVWFIEPPGAAAGWADTALWRKAAAIPGVAVHRDEAMLEARRFGAGTSGQALLYDGSGELWFQGGITLSRGHSGDNPGRRAVASLVEQKLRHEVGTPVFGCPLFPISCNRGNIACQP